MFANGIIFSLKSLYRNDIVLYIYFTDKPVDFFPDLLVVFKGLICL